MLAWGTWVLKRAERIIGCGFQGGQRDGAARRGLKDCQICKGVEGLKVLVRMKIRSPEGDGPQRGQGWRWEWAGLDLGEAWVVAILGMM